MTLWKTEYGWRDQFQKGGIRYSLSGYLIKKEVAKAGAERKKNIKKEQVQMTSDTGFKTIANEYLDLSGHKHTKKTKMIDMVHLS